MANYTGAKQQIRKRTFSTSLWFGAVYLVQNQLGENYISSPVVLIGVMWKQPKPQTRKKLQQSKSQRQTQFQGVKFTFHVYPHNGLFIAT